MERKTQDSADKMCKVRGSKGCDKIRGRCRQGLNKKLHVGDPFGTRPSLMVLGKIFQTGNTEHVLHPQGAWIWGRGARGVKELTQELASLARERLRAHMQSQ